VNTTIAGVTITPTLYVSSIVRGGGTAGPGVLRRFQFYDQWLYIPWTSDHRSRSGRSGTVGTQLEKAGLYRVDEAAFGSRARGIAVFVVEEDGSVRELDVRRDLTDEMRRRDPDGANLIDSLPALSGSSRQIAWARDIRSRLVRLDPRHHALRTVTSASWWIDNRESL
jgi:hypothetical protein